MLVKTHRPIRKVSFIRRSRLDPVVDNGLTMTPSEMEKMRLMGQPISAQQLQSLTYQDDNPHWTEPAPEHMRGVDMAELWERGMDIRAKARSQREHEVDIVEPQKVS